MSFRNGNENSDRKQKLTLRERFRNRINKIIKPTKKETKKKQKKKESVIKKTFDKINKIIKPRKKYIKLPSGLKVEKSKLNTIEKRVQEINKSYSDRKESIVSGAKRVFGKEVGRMIERDIEIKKDKHKLGLTNDTFDDLKELSFEGILKKINTEDDIEKFETQLLENEFYDLDKRDVRYRENYIKAMYNTYGENTDTEELEKIIRELDIEVFILSYYNAYSNTELKDFYDEFQTEDYLEYLKAYFTRLKDVVL